MINIIGMGFVSTAQWVVKTFQCLIFYQRIPSLGFDVHPLSHLHGPQDDLEQFLTGVEEDETPPGLVLMRLALCRQMIDLEMVKLVSHTNEKRTQSCQTN